MAESARWYIRKDTKVWGPFTDDQVKAFAQSNKIRADTLVATDKAGPWLPAADAIKSLFASSASTNAKSHPTATPSPAASRPVGATDATANRQTVAEAVQTGTSNADLANIAEKMNGVLGWITFSVIANLFLPMWIVLYFLYIRDMRRLANAMKQPTPWLALVLGVIPLLAALFSHRWFYKARKVLVSHGVSVGFTGKVAKKEIERLKTA
jgi:hypothetical protein